MQRPSKSCELWAESAQSWGVDPWPRRLELWAETAQSSPQLWAETAPRLWAETAPRLWAKSAPRLWAKSAQSTLLDQIQILPSLPPDPPSRHLSPSRLTPTGNEGGREARDSMKSRST